MAVKWISAGEKGIRYYEHPTRKHGVARDRYFAIRYKVEGKTKEEGLGWWSEGWNLDRAIAERSKLKESHRTGQGPATLQEQRTLAANTKAQAERQKQLEASQNVTLAEYWPVYLTSSKLIKADRKNERSWQVDQGLFDNWLKPLLGNVSIKDIGVDEWDRLMGTLVDAGLAPRTRQYVALVLRQVLAFAYSRKLVAFPPPQARDVGATLGRGGNRRTRILSMDELTKILETLASRDQLAYRFTLFTALTGCRFSEAASLEWKDVDLGQGEVIFRRTKNGEDRTIPLSRALLELLSNLRNLGHVTGHVFLSGTGRPYTTTPQPFRDTVEALGLNEGRSKRDRVVFHTLRHSAATRLAKSGTSLPDLQKLCGWKSPHMALRYAKGVDETMRKAINGLGDELLKPSNVVDLFNK